MRLEADANVVRTVETGKMCVNLRFCTQYLEFVGVQYMLDRKRGKRQKDEDKSVKVELLHLTQPRGGRILHEQEYNTGHGIQAIPNEICREIWRQPSKPKVQQKPVVHLLLEGALGRLCEILSLPVQTSPQPRLDRTVVSSKAAKLYPFFQQQA